MIGSRAGKPMAAMIGVGTKRGAKGISGLVVYRLKVGPPGVAGDGTAEGGSRMSTGEADDMLILESKWGGGHHRLYIQIISILYHRGVRM
jgi:hypothetical protein